jgi:hypothetical protein
MPIAMACMGALQAVSCRPANQRRGQKQCSSMATLEIYEPEAFHACYRVYGIKIVGPETCSPCGAWQAEYLESHVTNVTHNTQP